MELNDSDDCHLSIYICAFLCNILEFIAKKIPKTIRKTTQPEKIEDRGMKLIKIKAEINKKTNE